MTNTDSADAVPPGRTYGRDTRGERYEYSFCES